MAGARNHRKPTFHWQAILIVLPVIVLAVFGAVSLRQDRVLVEHEANERAQAAADRLASRLWSALTATNTDDSDIYSFQVNDAGDLLFPPSYPAVPTPKSFAGSEFTAEQRRVWMAVQQVGGSETDPAEGIRNCRELIASNPPEDVAASASYAMGLLLIRQHQHRAAAAEFEQLRKLHPDACGDSGLPLRPLAELQLSRLAAADDSLGSDAVVSLDLLLSNAVFYPTLLTPELFQQTKADGEKSGGRDSERDAVWSRWWNLWQRRELTRRLYSIAREHLFTNNQLEMIRLNAPRADAGSPTVTVAQDPEPGFSQIFWFSAPEGMEPPSSGGRPAWSDHNWIAVQGGIGNSGRWYRCRTELDTGLLVHKIVEAEGSLPEYMGVGVELAGQRVRSGAPDLRIWYRTDHFSPKSPGGIQKKEYAIQEASQVLASAKTFGWASMTSGDLSKHLATGPELLKVNVFLTSPSDLFRHQRAHTFWFGALILASTTAALVGLWAAWRAFKQQQQLNEIKGNFVSSVSHELRAPIASVRLLAESLELGKVTEPLKQNEYFHFMVQECRRLSSLIENVLDFSRIEQGRKQYDFEPTDLAALTRATVKLMEPYAAEKEVQLVFEPSSPESKTVKLEWQVDGRAIQQALVNLIDNAIKHSPQGQIVTVGIEGRSEKGETQAGSPDNPGQTCNLFVADHGPGIPLEEHEKIFERFYRRGSELRRETQGVGIGLSLVKHIVEAHGGRVLVESEVGKGSRFTIQLRRRDEKTNVEP